MPTGFRPRAFCCYDHADSETVGAVVALLDAYGIEVWQDAQNLDVGRDWHDAIRQAIADSDAVLVFLGAAGLRPEQVAEVEHAATVGTQAIPVVIGGYRDPAPPAPLDAIQAVDFRAPRPFAVSAQRLAQAVRDLQTGRAFLRRVRP